MRQVDVHGGEDTPFEARRRGEQPEVGGLQPREALSLLRGLNGLDVVGADVVEVAPQYDATTNTAQIGAQALFTELCLAVTALRRRRAGD